METAGNTQSTNVHNAGVNVAAAALGQNIGSMESQGVASGNSASSQGVAVAMAGAGPTGGPVELLGSGNADLAETPAKRPRRSGCRDIGVYEQMSKIGEGTYGEVYRTTDPATGKLLAIKKIKMKDESDGFPISATREIKALKTLASEHIVNLVEVCTTQPSRYNRMMCDVFMVFEYFDFDLAALLSKYHAQMTEAQRKSYMFQLLSGLDFMHRKRHLHRDLKPANLLITRSHKLVLADFGLVKHVPEGYGRDLTSKVCTLHFRAPEVLLGARQYNGRSDVWAAGLIFAQMFSGHTALPGEVEMEQVKNMAQLLGSPSLEELDSLRKCRNFQTFESHLEQDAELYPRSVAKRYGKLMSPLALDLLEKMLTWTPVSRLKASEALRHPYFSDVSPHSSLPPWQIEAAHDFALRESRRQNADAHRERSASRSVSRGRSMLDGARTGGSKRSRDDVSVSRSPSRGTFATMERAAPGRASSQQHRSRSSSQLRGMTMSRSKSKPRFSRPGSSMPRPQSSAPKHSSEAVQAARSRSVSQPRPTQPAGRGPPQPASRGPPQPASRGPPQPASRGPPQPASRGPPQPASRGPPQPASRGPPQPKSAGQPMS